MKRVVIVPLLVLLLASFGCESKPKSQGPTNLDVGKSQLINNGNALEAVQHLEKAEEEAVNKLEPRALLVIAYSYGLSTGDANSVGEAARFKNQRSQRIQELTEAEMKHILQVLSQPSQVRKAGLQALVEKGHAAAVLILDSLENNRYQSLHADFTQMLIDMGTDELDLILASLTDETTPLTLKSTLVHVLAEIGDAKALDALKSVQAGTSNTGLAMEINTTLYQLGEVSYKNDIIAGLSGSTVEVRRAAAKAMVNIDNAPTKTLIAGLKDTDSETVTALVEALAVHKDATAVDSLLDVLISDQLNKDPKQAAIDTLEVYGQNKLARGLAKDATMLLIGGTVSKAENRLYLVQLLRREPFKKQIKALKTIEDLGSKLHAYYSKESEDLVKDRLAKLLDEVQ